MLKCHYVAKYTNSHTSPDLKAHAASIIKGSHCQVCFLRVKLHLRKAFWAWLQLTSESTACRSLAYRVNHFQLVHPTPPTSYRNEYRSCYKWHLADLFFSRAVMILSSTIHLLLSPKVIQEIPLPRVQSIIFQLHISHTTVSPGNTEGI